MPALARKRREPPTAITDYAFHQDRGKWRRNWPYPVMDGCATFVSDRWREAQYEVDCGVYYTPVSGGNVSGWKKNTLKNDPI